MVGDGAGVVAGAVGARLTVLRRLRGGGGSEGLLASAGTAVETKIAPKSSAPGG